MYNLTTLYVMCGIPGSGKTTLSKKLAMRHDLKRISFDEEHYYEHIEFVQPTISLLTEGYSVILDSVFSIRCERESILKHVKDLECRKILILMKTPYDECIRRNSKRDNPLPVFVLECMDKTFEHPTLDEGWDEIIYV